MDEALRLRELVVRAVCSKDYEHLPRLLRLLAKLNPTEEVLRGSGIGHLVGDRHLWGLAGFTVQQRAAALLARWRLAFRQCRAGTWPSGKAPPKPFGGYGSKAFLAHVWKFEKELTVHTRDVSCAASLSGSKSCLDGLLGYKPSGGHS